jgi:hypothetical protein
MAFVATTVSLYYRHSVETVRRATRAWASAAVAAAAERVRL